MKHETLKLKIISGVLSGLIFAVLMAGFDYYDAENFSVVKFIFHAVFFGFFMGILAKDKRKKSEK
ncbi:MAG: hypothetical protein COB60_05260 [Flavobacteriaceae bacterium]|nr:MAG: hypothetical protein COB60_05260 [Flavobacteriaceae bacterium]